MYKLRAEGNTMNFPMISTVCIIIHVHVFRQAICIYQYIILYTDGDGMVADLIWQHSLAHRIHCMWYGDLTHDGLSELAIVSTGGVHVLQVTLMMIL